MAMARNVPMETPRAMHKRSRGKSPKTIQESMAPSGVVNANNRAKVNIFFLVYVPLYINMVLNAMADGTLWIATAKNTTSVRGGKARLAPRAIPSKSE